MNHTDLILFIFSLAILLLMAIISGRLAQYLKMPKVIGELIGGIILGPTILGLFYPDIKQLLFASSGSVFQARDAFVKLGAMLLLFVIGLEINLPRIKELRKTIVWTSFFGSSFPFILGLTSVFLFPQIWNYSPDQNKWLLPLFIGTALSISALPVIARILLDLGLLKSKVGSIILATATIDDIVGWIMFAIIVANFSPDAKHINPAMTALGILAMFAFTLTFGKKLAKRLTLWSEKKNDSDSLFLGITLVLILLGATLAEKIGIHAVLGAFLVGIAFSNSEPHKMHTAMRQMVLSFFSPLYFVAVGLQVDFLKHFDLILVLSVIGIATLGKVLGAFIGAKISKLTTQEALAVGFGMNARGAVEIILATSAYQAKLIDERIFVAIVIMAIVTSLISGSMMKKILENDYSVAGTEDEKD
jgi:Kef-type K+ transport system membrane component KefB